MAFRPPENQMGPEILKRSGYQAGRKVMSQITEKGTVYRYRAA